jgi:N-formylmaleamate deformylase
MLAWPTTFLPVDGATLCVYRSTTTPTGRTPIVLVHGFTDNALYWTRLADALASEHDVYAYDARGHGASSRLTSAFDDEIRAADLLRVVDALALDRPVAIGHSMGGSTVANAAARRPEAFRALVLEDPAWWELTGLPAEHHTAVAAAMLQRRTDWRARIEVMRAAGDAEQIEMVRAGNPDWSPTDMALSRNARLQVDPAVFEHYPTVEAPWKAAVAAWRCPALLVLGSRGDAIIRPQLADDARAINELVQWVQIPDAAHSIRFGQFEAYLAAVREFLKSPALRPG